MTRSRKPQKMRKTRITVTIDPPLVAAANAAIAAGRTGSLSSWVNQALAELAAKERRIAAGWEAIRSYEAEFGPITDEEMEATERADRRNAIRVRGRRGVVKRRKAA
jgi:Arc/MetJ-type ribon-helix-helix transcriptional regulator